MKREFSILKRFILEEVENLKEEWRSEPYDKKLYDDEPINKKSTYVPDDIKKSIKNWIKDMGLG